MKQAEEKKYRTLALQIGGYDKEYHLSDKILTKVLVNGDEIFESEMFPLSRVADAVDKLSEFYSNFDVSCIYHIRRSLYWEGGKQYAEIYITTEGWNPEYHETSDVVEEQEEEEFRIPAKEYLEMLERSIPQDEEQEELIRTVVVFDDTSVFDLDEVEADMSPSKVMSEYLGIKFLSKAKDTVIGVNDNVQHHFGPHIRIIRSKFIGKMESVRIINEWIHDTLGDLDPQDSE